MKQVLVSVVVPVYNVMPYLVECLQSIMNQTYKNLEIILIDDGSKDGSGDICNEYSKQDARITVVHQMNQGVVKARDTGIKMASGNFIMFVDGDDTIEPIMVEYLIEHIQDCDLISAGVCQELKNKKEMVRYDQYPEGKYQGIQMKKIQSNLLQFDERTSCHYLTPFMVNKLYRTELLKNIYSNIPVDLTYAEDLVFTCINLLNSTSMVITHKCLYRYRYRESSAVHCTNKRRLIEINKVYLTLYEYLKKSVFKETLLMQLERWVTVRTFRAINYQMGFCNLSSFSEFQINVEDLKAKRIILYGAGKMGCDCHKILRYNNVEIVMWIDKRYNELRKNGLDVNGIDDIANVEYDFILIAVSRKEQAEEISEELQKSGIDIGKIIWKEPDKILY